MRCRGRSEHRLAAASSGYPLGVSLTPSATSAVAVSAAAIAVVGLVLGLVAQVRLRRLRRSYSVLQSGDGESSFVDAAARTSREVEVLRRDVAILSAGLDDARVDLSDAIRHVAVVRYDAFGDMGGRLSFSAALLDDSGDGLVLSSIAGRTETRTYAKGVKHGTSEAQLSPEEEQVVGWALRGRAGAAKGSTGKGSTGKGSTSRGFTGQGSSGHRPPGAGSAQRGPDLGPGSSRATTHDAAEETGPATVLPTAADQAPSP